MARSIGQVAFLIAVGVFALAPGRLLADRSLSESTFSVAFSAPAPPKVESEKLIQNVKVFYNPVAEQIVLNFKLSKQSTVSVKMMDALGNEVLNLMNGKLDEGQQNLAFEANGKLTTGIYFVRVNSGAEVVVKRMSVR